MITRIEIKTINNKNYFKIYINTNINFNLHIFSKKSNVQYITKLNLIKLIKKENMIYILSTSNGVCSTNNFNNTKALGGILLFGIS